MRITGMATGMDIDSIVKDSMKPYRIKIDKVKQDKDRISFKQEMYRDLVKESREFYNKYFDLQSEDNLIMTKNYETVKFTSKDDVIATARGEAGAKAGNYTVTVDELAEPSKIVKTVDELNGKKEIKFKYRNKEVKVNIDGLTDKKEIARKLNAEASSIGLKVEYSDFAKGFVFETRDTGKLIEGEENKFELTIDSGVAEKSDGEKNAKVTIENSRGEKVEYSDSKEVLASNKVKIDGIEFSFNKVGKTDISGKVDVTDAKKKIVSFVKDYNKLMENLNKLTNQTKAKGYNPLTEDQKKEMSKEEIELWNKKVKQGLLYRDNDVTRLVNNLKNAMSSVVNGSSIALKDIGLTPVKDFKDKNGTFTLDENKLTKALEENSDLVMDLFLKSPKENDTNEKKFQNSGIFQRLKTVLYDETVTVTAPIIKKAGVEGSVTVVNNELTKMLQKKDRKIEDMEKDFTRREQQLYTKYSKLETAMNKLNAQQASLSQQLGGV